MAIENKRNLRLTMALFQKQGDRFSLGLLWKLIMRTAMGHSDWTRIRMCNDLCPPRTGSLNSSAIWTLLMGAISLKKYINPLVSISKVVLPRTEQSPHLGFLVQLLSSRCNGQFQLGRGNFWCRTPDLDSCELNLLRF